MKVAGRAVLDTSEILTLEIREPFQVIVSPAEKVKSVDPSTPTPKSSKLVPESLSIYAKSIALVIVLILIVAKLEIRETSSKSFVDVYSPISCHSSAPARPSPSSKKPELPAIAEPENTH